ncbi:hypothetical protein BD289DRAFT_426433 [Coniella lustricola]|uniref:Uncharacterized protein n=1 Tax=Coniella lustricola TaxID=2025994 RepID=A0A2T3AG08_9PEZI|nr:hypothetical protein BD289DRAFT_426433 [Coniella lustricola]
MCVCVCVSRLERQIGVPRVKRRVCGGWKRTRAEPTREDTGEGGGEEEEEQEQAI